MFDFLSLFQEYHFIKILLTFLLSFILTFTIIPKITETFTFKGWSSQTFKGKSIRVTPTIGGVAILIGTIISLLILSHNEVWGEVFPIIGLGFIIALVGFIDDFSSISALKKLIIQITVAIYLIVILNLRIISLDGFLNLNELQYITSFIISLMFYILIINAFNLIDGIDGLLGSISLMISIFFGFKFWYTDFQYFSFLNFALSGSLLAFLWFNIFSIKNKIFIGDSGAMFVGLLLSSSAVKAINIDMAPNYTILSLFAYPLFDTLRVFIIRVTSKRSPFAPDMNHFHHILLKNGLSQLKATIVILSFNLVCLFSVMYVPLNTTFLFVILFLVFILAAYVLSNNSVLIKVDTLVKFFSKILFINYVISISLIPLYAIKKVFSLFLDYFLRFRKIKKKEKQNPNSSFDVLELYHSLRLKSNPFSRFSAEEELEYIDAIYYIPKYFKPLFADVKNGLTRFILGARGVGKTALLIKLVKQLNKSDVFSIIIDDYEGIPIENNSKYFLENTIKKVVSQYAILISNSPFLIKNLNKRDKEKLTFFIENFFSPVTRKEYESTINVTSQYKSKNLLIKAYNLIVTPVNSLLSVGIEIGSDMIKKSSGLDNYNSTMVYKDYLKEIKEVNPNKTLFIESANYNSYKEVLCDLSKIIKKSGFEQVVILYDKIDENIIFGGDLNKITSFLSEILLDTNLLLKGDFSLVFSLWNELKENLYKIHVRFDKIIPIDVTWNNNELVQIIDARLSYFSANPLKTIKLEEILEETRSLEEIINLSNKSPRDLLRLISSIYYEQAHLDNRSPFMSTQAIKKGILKFVSEYDYYSIYAQIEPNDDILKNVKKILVSGRLTFKDSDLSQDLNISNTESKRIIKNLLKLGLIAELNQSQSNVIVYEITDPKIVWLMRNQMNPWSN